MLSLKWKFKKKSFLRYLTQEAPFKVKLKSIYFRKILFGNTTTLS
jgi:hypothetical protein